MIDSALVTTVTEIPNYRVARNFGIVRGLVVRSRSIVGNIGATLQTLLGGNITIYTELCEKARADAAYDGTVADYRQTVLTAMQETEDALATLRLLAREAEAQEQAVRSARESERIAQNQYKAGTVSYLNVVVVQAAALNAERNALALQVRRLNAAVALVKALGGGW